MEKKHTSHRNPNPHYDGTDRLTAEGRDELKESDFGLPGRRFPMPDANTFAQPKRVSTWLRTTKKQNSRVIS